MKISAFAAYSSKEPLRAFTYEVPPLDPHEILVKISHCGLCHSDIHLIDDDWKRSRYPLVPGHEIVGAVVKKGDACDYLQIGQRIGISWIRSACLQCPTCLLGETNACPLKTSTCNGYHGGFADYMIADGRFVYPVPDSLDSAHAAPLLCAGATVYAPLRKHSLKGLPSVAVFGIGGLGHLGLQFAAALGCETAAISHTPSKKDEAHFFGAVNFYTLNDLPPPFQFDLILSTVHADLDWNRILTLLKPNGTLSFLGRPAARAQIDIAHLLSYQRNISGHSTSNRTIMNEMLQFAASRNIKPQIELLPLSEVNQAIERVKSNTVRYRAVLEMDERKGP